MSRKGNYLELTDVKRLKYWFGGTSEVRYSRGKQEYTIILHTDDAPSDVVFVFSDQILKTMGEAVLWEQLAQSYLALMKRG